MKIATIAASLLSLLAIACSGDFDTDGQTLAEARKGVAPALTQQVHSDPMLDTPPAGVLDLISYRSPAGPLAAYLTSRPQAPGKYPALIWITGGDFTSISDVWSPAPPNNDQTAAAFRRGTMVVMYPSLRGGNRNPGTHEGFYGEVDDVIAAMNHLKSLDYVDPKRIYLGGHSSGATLVMLVAEMTDGFRAAFAFGPVGDPSLYADGMGPDFLPFDTSDKQALALRSPRHWLGSVRTPLFVIEGDKSPGNADQLAEMQAANRNPLVQFRLARGHDHFSVLAPATRLLADRIATDTGPTPAIALDEAEIAAR